MNIEIVSTPFVLDLHGFSGIASSNDHVAVAFGLMNKMWEVVTSASLKNKGRNIWVYESGNRVFAGVQLEDPLPHETELEHREIVVAKYARCLHVGSYGLIRKSGVQMREELAEGGYRIISHYIEIYGHGMEDESKQETELIMALG